MQKNIKGSWDFEAVVKILKADIPLTKAKEKELESFFKPLAKDTEETEKAGWNSRLKMRQVHAQEIIEHIFEIQDCDCGAAPGIEVKETIGMRLKLSPG